MSDKLREDFEKYWSERCGSDNYIERREISGIYYEADTRKAWSVYKAATERAARICDKSQCCECGGGELLAKEIRGE